MFSCTQKKNPKPSKQTNKKANKTPKNERTNKTPTTTIKKTPKPAKADFRSEL